MIAVLAAVFLRQVRAATTVAPTVRVENSPRPRAAGATSARAERAPPAGEAPPGRPRTEPTEPEDALLALLVELAWRCWRSAAEENDDEQDSTDTLRAPGLRLRAAIDPRSGRASPGEHRAPVSVAGARDRPGLAG